MSPPRSIPDSDLRASSKHLLPWLVAVAFFMEALDTTILNTGVPTIAEALKVAPLSMKSVLASYTQSLAVFIPIQRLDGGSVRHPPRAIASTMRQISMSFGVASASLVTALFIPDRFHSSAVEMIRGIHKAFFVLGGLTILSTIVFRELKSGDGDNVSQHGQVDY